MGESSLGGLGLSFHQLKPCFTQCHSSWLVSHDALSTVPSACGMNTVESPHGFCLLATTYSKNGKNGGGNRELTHSPPSFNVIPHLLAHPYPWGNSWPFLSGPFYRQGTEACCGDMARQDGSQCISEPLSALRHVAGGMWGLRWTVRGSRPG